MTAPLTWPALVATAASPRQPRRMTSSPGHPSVHHVGLREDSPPCNITENIDVLQLLAGICRRLALSDATHEKQRTNTSLCWIQ